MGCSTLDTGAIDEVLWTSRTGTNCPPSFRKASFPLPTPTAVNPRPSAAPTENSSCTLSVEQPVKITSSQINHNPEVSPPAPAHQEILPHHGLACHFKTLCTPTCIFSGFPTKSHQSWVRKKKKRKNKLASNSVIGKTSSQGQNTFWQTTCTRPCGPVTSSWLDGLYCRNTHQITSLQH